MAKLTKAQIKKHDEALALLEKDELTHEDKLFIFEHWQESADHVNSKAGAFFTPWALAKDFALEMNTCARVLDLCAGIGTLSYAYWWRTGGKTAYLEKPISITCVEQNPAYIELGKRILPEATWIEADIFDLPELGEFDIVISNPPFGALKRTGDGPRYTGRNFEYHVIDIASQYSDCGAFIIPPMSAGFSTSGPWGFQRQEGREFQKFRKETGIFLDVGVGIEANNEQYSGWKQTSPMVEVCTALFNEETI